MLAQFMFRLWVVLSALWSALGLSMGIYAHGHPAGWAVLGALVGAVYWLLDALVPRWKS